MLWIGWVLISLRLLDATPCASVGSLSFSAEEPAKKTLSICKEHEEYSCCNRSHTDALSRLAMPFFDDLDQFSEQCRQLTLNILCAPCHHDVGTGRKPVCTSLCNRWYEACSSGLFSEIGGELVPCTSSSLVCFPLRETFSGRSFCQAAAVSAGLPVGGSKHFLASFLAEDEFEDASECYGGSVPSPFTTFKPKSDRRRSKPESQFPLIPVLIGTLTVLLVACMLLVFRKKVR